jgi:hypothetical protein
VATDKDLDRFCGGITAPRKPAVYNPDGERPQPEYGDEWANKAFNIKGPDLFEIQRRSHTDGANRRK